MYSIGHLVKTFAVSRSTLLYYDKIGLLKPSGRSGANYRQYTQKDLDRMAQIVLYREAGLSLEAIAELLDSSGSQSANILQQRLNHLNDEISHLRRQQQLIVKLLGKRSLLKRAKVMNKAQWVKILRASGMDDEAMRQWHIEFERDLPEVHTDFLESLGIDEKEITEIKAFS